MIFLGFRIIVINIISISKRVGFSLVFLCWFYSASLLLFVQYDTRGLVGFWVWGHTQSLFAVFFLFCTILFPRYSRFWEGVSSTWVKSWVAGRIGLGWVGRLVSLIEEDSKRVVE